MTATEITLVKKVAEKVVEPLEQEQWSEDDKLFRIRVKRGPGSKLVSVILSKIALWRLMNDPQREVKLEYLRRDIQRQAKCRREYRYPRQLAHA